VAAASVLAVVASARTVIAWSARSASRASTVFFKDGGRFANYWCVVRSRGGARTAFVVTAICAVSHVGYDCPGNVYEYEVTDVWLFAAGEELPVTLQPEQPLP